MSVTLFILFANEDSFCFSHSILVSIDRSSLRHKFFICSDNCFFSGTAISAAAVGVGALLSAT